jgi:membrane-bound lytic murein transglycosylase B
VGVAATVVGLAFVGPFAQFTQRSEGLIGSRLASVARAATASTPTGRRQAPPDHGTVRLPRRRPAARPLADVGAHYGGGTLTGIPAPVLAAYRAAARDSAEQDPSCHLDWSVLAGIGEIESHHAAAGGSDRQGWNGIARPPIYGPLLDGSAGETTMADTDDGRLDGNASYDRAVGPMQFMPATWKEYGVDADGDGVANPQDIRDATATAARYLCAGGHDLGNAPGEYAAILSYNHSADYVRDVMAAAAGYLAESYGRSPQGVAEAAVGFAYARLGDPYLWGGNGPLYDCSGLTQAAYRSAGIEIPRTSEDQWLALPHVNSSDPQPGDLVFFNSGEFRSGLPGHVGIYLGHGFMIDDPYTGAVVRFDRVAASGALFGVARPALLDPHTGALPGSGLVLPTPGSPAPSGGRHPKAPQPTATVTVTATPTASGPRRSPTPTTSSGPPRPTTTSARPTSSSASPPATTSGPPTPTSSSPTAPTTTGSSTTGPSSSSSGDPDGSGGTAGSPGASPGATG